MFSILISEKGGSERREHYDQAEISIGRVQGNGLVLPKGNVSKRHARLLYREDRFIITDLKSTNGTYVNGRKIAQATIVREGDKIYIGDFVLRIESTQTALIQPSQPNTPGSPGFFDDGPPGATSPHPPASPGRSTPQGSLPPSPRASAPRITSMPNAGGFISHFPLERDPDEVEPAYVPGPPRVPTGPRMALQAQGTNGPPALGAPIRATSPSPGASNMPPQLGQAPRVPPIDVAAQARRRGWLAALVQRVNAALDEPVQVQTTAALARRVTDVLGVQAGLMAASGELPAEVEVETLVAEASRELLSTGPIEALLADEEVQEIHIASHDQIIVTAARVQLVSEVAFTSEVALTRALDRLCASAGQPLLGDEVYVERRLARGVRLFAILPKPPGHGQIAVLRKPQRADLSLEDLVHLGTISHAMAGLLRLSITARANVLVTGSIGSGTTSFVAALASAGRSDDRVIVLQEDDEFILNQPHTVSLLLDDAPDVRVRTVRAAARMHPDRLVVGAFAGVVATEIVDAIGDGIDGVLAAAHAPTIRQAMLRLPADLAATRIGLSPEAAREWLASAFDLAVEIARLPDGQHRVMRIVEPSIEANALVVRDVFAFTAGRTTPGGAIDGAFHASGLVPRIIEDLIAKGVTVDASIFKRTSSR